MINTFTVSVTERQEFKRCRRKWDYGSLNRQALTRLVTKKALSLGTLIHSSLEDWLINPDGNLVDFYMKHSVEEYEKIQAEYKSKIGADISEAEIAPFLDISLMGRAMVTNYQAFWKKPLHSGFEVVATEQKVNYEIAPGYILEAKLDGLIKDRKNRIYILEHKTYSSRPTPDSLNSNDQFLAYLWIANKLDIGEIAGIAYDGLWKREKPPRNCTEKDLFTRVLLHRTKSELDEFERFILQEISEMRQVAEQAEKHPELLYINRRWEGCYDCAFEPLCKAQSAGDDVEHILNNFYTKRSLRRNKHLLH